jgi:hypothetical protein
VPGNVWGIVWQIAAVHVDQVKHEAVCTFEIAGHANGALEEIAGIGFVIGEPVHRHDYTTPFKGMDRLPAVDNNDNADIGDA